ncbi:MAG TPA: DUF3015 family protein [Burkholderiales bacterium]
MKKLCAVAVLAAFPVAAMAAGENNVGSCGVGSKAFDGQAGIVPQVLAITTNHVTFNTFAISTGTSGCTPDGKVTSNWKMAMFIDGNKVALQRDMSVGGGESLDSLAHLMGIEAQDRVAFNSLAKDNLAKIFPSEGVATEQVVTALREVLKSDARLGRYVVAL